MYLVKLSKFKLMFLEIGLLSILILCMLLFKYSNLCFEKCGWDNIFCVDLLCLVIICLIFFVVYCKFFSIGLCRLLLFILLVSWFKKMSRVMVVSMVI